MVGLKKARTGSGSVEKWTGSSTRKQRRAQVTGLRGTLTATAVRKQAVIHTFITTA